MENVATKPYRRIRPEHNNKWGGLVLIIIGVLFLLAKMPATKDIFPTWFFTWPVLLIGMGLFTAVKSRFRNVAWLILTIIGTYFLLYENDMISVNLRPYAFPIGIIILGLLVIFKKNRFHKDRERLFRERMHRRDRFMKHWHPGSEGEMIPDADSSEDTVHVSSTFGNIERNVFSKNFQGGSISSAFGGAQVNFTQADFQGTAIVDISIM
ncbi:MAG TPA: DUF5668 domain-containing protein, partial [Chitinophagaceae bacterium]|nr:DUF5668 domain-containing protein [Chitinophagaceae bacterium]